MSTFGILILLQAIINIPAPEGYSRTPTDDFGNFLRSIRLKSDKTVYLYNGQKKANQSAQYAVLDISVGNKDLQQCADAVMRLRAEWLYKKSQFDKIMFKSVGGIALKFKPPYERGNFMKYMDGVFNTCNSWSLERDLTKKIFRDIQPGDVLIKGGFPGHVVIVVDMAISKTGEKVFMIAQSYMPAQDIHVLKGPVAEVWYPVKEGEIITPEWTFQSNQLKGW